jgi:hypothetical protein
MSLGLGLSAYGEIAFSPVGFAMCASARFARRQLTLLPANCPNRGSAHVARGSVLSALRLVLSHTLLHAEGADRMDSLSMLTVMAPVCAAGLLPVAVRPIPSARAARRALLGPRAALTARASRLHSC